MSVPLVPELPESVKLPTGWEWYRGVGLDRVRERQVLIRVEPAPWDEAVFGLSSVVLVVDSNTEPFELNQKLHSLSSQIVTVRIPTGCGPLQDVMSAENFSFREIQFTFQSPPSLPAWLELGQSAQFVLKEGNVDDLEIVKSWLTAGLISTDRFAADANLGLALAGKRYASWLADEVANGASLKVIERKGLLVGFFSLRDRDGEPYIALSGVNSKTKVPGAGMVLHRFILEEIFRGFSGPLRPVVGSSNLPAMRVHIRCGYALVDAHEVYMAVSASA